MKYGVKIGELSNTKNIEGNIKWLYFRAQRVVSGTMIFTANINYAATGTSKERAEKLAKKIGGSVFEVEE